MNNTNVGGTVLPSHIHHTLCVLSLISSALSVRVISIVRALHSRSLYKGARLATSHCCFHCGCYFITKDSQFFRANKVFAFNDWVRDVKTPKFFGPARPVVHFSGPARPVIKYFIIGPFGPVWARLGQRKYLKFNIL